MNKILKIETTTKENLNKKVLNRIYYDKVIIRNTFLKSTKLKTLDYYDNLINFDFSKNYKVFKPTFFNIGQYLNLKHIFFKNKLNLDIKFLYFLNNNEINRKIYLNNFNKTLMILKKINNTINNKFIKMLILGPVKGGFTCYSLGIRGFLPKTHANYLFKVLKKLILKKIKKNTNSFSSLFLLISPKPILINSFYIGKVSIYPELKPYKVFKFKRYKYNNCLNIVFLTKSQKN